MSGVLNTNNQAVDSGKTLNRVLVVDDDPDMRMYLAMIIASTWEDADVVEYDPVRQSVAEIGGWADYDVVILDYLFGESSDDPTGLDWLRKYAGQAAYPPTVFVSAYGDEDVVKEALSLGALCFVSKGEAFADRLIGAIESLPDLHGEQALRQWSLPADVHPDMQVSEAELNSHQRVEIEVPQEEEALCGFLVVRIDQFGNLGKDERRSVLVKLEHNISAWVLEDGAKLNRSERFSDHLIFCISQLLGEDHLEMIVQGLCSRVKKQGLGLWLSRASVSIGAVLAAEDIANKDEAALLASANRACEQALAEGGDGFVLKSMEPQKTQSKVMLDGAFSLPVDQDIDVTSMIRSRKLGIQFQPVLSAHSEQAAPFYMSVPRIELAEDECLEPAQERRLLAALENNLDMDRLAVIQAQKLLRAASTHKDSRVIIEVSCQSATSPTFWLWLIKRLRDSVDGLRMIFAISIRDIHHPDLARNAIFEASYHGKFRIGLTGLVDAYTPEKLPDILPLRLLMGDMAGDFTINRCEQTVKLGAYAHQQNMDYVLRGVDSGEKLVCAYAAKADMMHGLLNSEFTEMQIKPLDTSFSGGADRVLWFDSRKSHRHALRLAKVRRRESKKS